jgi:hypothetical protein
MQGHTGLVPLEAQVILESKRSRMRVSIGFTVAVKIGLSCEPEGLKKHKWLVSEQWNVDNVAMFLGSGKDGKGRV